MTTSSTSPPPDALDVLVVGAGLSGIAVGRYLRVEHPAKTFMIMEQRPSTGGTWDLFRYPGVRSDSDLQTYAYAFRPWPADDSIASGERILSYLRATLAEHDLDDHIVVGSRVISAEWSTAEALWTIEVADVVTGERARHRARWLFCAAGYFRYDQGHAPHFEGRHDFEGSVVHPQEWPTDLDWTGKRVVVIGSGATAVTLVPALAERAAHVTMLQRTPSYVLPLPTRSRSTRMLRGLLGEDRGQALVRQRNIAIQRVTWLACRRFPTAARRQLRRITRARLPRDYPVDRHFNPPYDPWDQRLCVSPDGDLFAAIGRGDVSVVTDRIERFTRTGVRVRSGAELPADLIVTATGLQLQTLGGIELRVDGRSVSAADRVGYRGLMLSGVPNLAVALGYPNASWTLKIDLLCDYFCRLLTQLDDRGYVAACPVAEPGMPTQRSFYLTSGYVNRSVDELPKQGDRTPWRVSLSYYEDVRLLRRRPVVDEHLHLTRAAPPGSPAP